MSESLASGQPSVKTGWGWVLALGLVLIAAGIVAMFHPMATSLATGIVLAWVLIAGGVFAIVAGFTDIRDRGGWLYILMGLLALLAGILVMFNPFAGALSLVWAIGFWLVVSGVLQVAAAFRIRRGRGWLIFFGAVDIVLGVVLMVMDPVPAFFFLAIAIGVSFLFRGIGSLMFALELRRLARY